MSFPRAQGGRRTPHLTAPASGAGKGHPMPRNFYYRPQAQIVSGSANFAAMITADFATLGIPVAMATEYSALDATLQAAWTTAQTPATRTKIAVQAKDEAIRAVRTCAIGIAKRIMSVQTVPDSTLLDLGLNPRPTYASRGNPEGVPVLEVKSVNNWLVDVRVHSSVTAGRGKAPNAMAAQVFSYVGEEPATDPRQFHLEGTSTRGKLQILFPQTVPAGATAWLVASWLSYRGQPGIACQPVRVTIQGGLVTTTEVA